MPHDAEFVKDALSWADLLGFLPGGAAIEALAKPEEGASRGETLALGGGGSLLGGLAGAAGGALATGGMEGEPGEEQYRFSPMAALGGGLLGSGAGNILGRWLARHDKRPEDKLQEDQIRQILEALTAQKGAGGGANITITMPGAAGNKEADNA